jgi:4-hydroxybenzoate polyprenyltransferase
MRLAEALWRTARPGQALLNLPVPAMGFLFAAEREPFPSSSFLLGLAGAALLFAHVLAFNNYGGFESDRRDPRKAFVPCYDRLGRRGLLLWSLTLLLAALAAGGAISPLFAGQQVVIAGAWMLYAVPPVYLKGRFPWPAVIHLLSGPAYFALGGEAAGGMAPGGWIFGLYFGAAITAGHFCQEAADAPVDLASGTATFAVRWGPKAGMAAGLTFFAAALALAAALGWGGWLPWGEAACLGLPNAIVIPLGLLRWPSGGVERRVPGFIRLYRRLYLLGGLAFLILHLHRVPIVLG